MAKTVLVVDDYSDFRKIISIVLKRYGYDIIEAADGYEAVEKAVEEHPDMILLDLAMPVLDGIEAVKAIRRHGELENTPIVAITAYHDLYDEKARDAGCNDVLAKPVRIEHLEPIVSRYLH
jgi:CheY-like chemotaxis protein